MAIEEAQLVDLFAGFIKAQAATIQAIATPEEIMARVIPALQDAAGITGREPMTLSNWPARALVSVVTGNRIDSQTLRDLLQPAVD